MTSREQFEEWFLTKYDENINNTDKKWPPYFRKFLDKLRPRELSGARRMNAFIATKYNYPLTKAGYLCSVFSCNFKTEKNTDTSGKNNSLEKNYDTYYSYVYWPRDVKYIESRFGGAARQKDFSTFQVKKKIMPEYMCISPTFNSRDGEYRGDGFITWESFQHGYEEYSELLSKVEEVIIALIEEKIISLDVTIYPIARKDDILSQIDEERLIVRIFAVAMLMDGHKFDDGVMQIHTNTDYMRLITMIYNNTILKDIAKSIDFYTYQGLHIFHNGKMYKQYRPRCGQKIIPLTIKETLEFKEQRHKVWREVDAQMETTDLVINFISPSFSIYNNWTFIDNDRDQGFFEGEFMRKKYMNSVASSLSMDSLKEAKKKVPVADKDDEEMKKIYDKWDVKIYNAIEYGETLLMLSKLSVCSLSEYVGYSFGSMPKYIKGLEIIEPAIENLFNDIDIFARHMFDSIYACHAMHTKLGIIQADLHLNNVTFFKSAPAYKVSTDDNKKIVIRPKFNNPMIAYIIGEMGSHDCYLLPHYGNYSCIIDFSRCYYGIQSIKRVAAERGKIYADNLFESQIDSMIAFIKKYAPKEFVDKYGGEFKNYARTNPDTFFKLLSPMDFIIFSRYLREGLKDEKSITKLESHERRFCKVSDDVLKFVDTIYINALALFMKNLNIAFVEKNKSESIDFTGAELIRLTFDKYLYANYTEEQRKKMDLVDVYNLNNKIKYSCKKYETWPDWAKAENIRENLYGLKLTDILDRGPDIVHRSFQPDPFMEAMIERERLDAEDIPDLMKSNVLPE